MNSLFFKGLVQFNKLHGPLKTNKCIHFLRKYKHIEKNELWFHGILNGELIMIIICYYYILLIYIIIYSISFSFVLLSVV